MRCQLMVVTRRPVRSAACVVSANSARLPHSNSTRSCSRSPRARSSRASRLALAFSAANVRSPLGAAMASASGWRLAQNATLMPTLAASCHPSGKRSDTSDVPSGGRVNGPGAVRTGGDGDHPTGVPRSRAPEGRSHRVRIGADDVRHHAHAFVEVDERDGIGHVFVP